MSRSPAPGVPMRITTGVARCAAAALSQAEGRTGRSSDPRESYPGAGRLPNVQGPQIKIEPPVTSATKITGERKID